MKKALAILGDLWHGAGPLQLEIVGKLRKTYTVDCILNYDVPFDRLSEYSLILLSRYGKNDVRIYQEQESDDNNLWLTEEQENLFLEYVNNGGKFLIHHDGYVYYRKGGGINTIARSYFIDHPPIRPINIRPVEGFDSLNNGIEPFEISDEEYNVVMDEDETNVFLESYSDANGRKPQAWHHNQGSGKVVVFVPGHDMGVLQHPMISRSLENIIQWLGNWPAGLTK